MAKGRRRRYAAAAAGIHASSDRGRCACRGPAVPDPCRRWGRDPWHPAARVGGDLELSRTVLAPLPGAQSVLYTFAAGDRFRNAPPLSIQKRPYGNLTPTLRGTVAGGNRAIAHESVTKRRGNTPGARGGRAERSESGTRSERREPARGRVRGRPLRIKGGTCARGVDRRGQYRARWRMPTGGHTPGSPGSTSGPVPSPRTVHGERSPGSPPPRPGYARHPGHPAHPRSAPRRAEATPAVPSRAARGLPGGARACGGTRRAGACPPPEDPWRGADPARG